MNVYGWTIQEVGDPGKGVLFVRVIPKMKDDGRLQISVNSSLGETRACLPNRNTAQSSADKQGSYALICYATVLPKENPADLCMLTLASA